MAIGDIGLFLPRESQFGTPGAFNKMLQAEALKRAAFLSNMDQFYENLAESKRQFNETLTFKTETRDLELAWAREQQDKNLAFQREELESTDDYRQGLLDLKEREIGDDLDFLEKQRIWRLIEADAKSRNEARESAAEGIGPQRTITPGSLWEGPGVETDRAGGRVGGGGDVTSGRVDVYNPYGVDKDFNAADLPGARRREDNPNWVVPEYSNLDENEYNYPNP